MNIGCPNCGNGNPEGSAFCQKCGVDLRTYRAAPPAGPSPRPKKNRTLLIVGVVILVMIIIGAALAGTPPASNDGGDDDDTDDGLYDARADAVIIRASDLSDDWLSDSLTEGGASAQVSLIGIGSSSLDVTLTVYDSWANASAAYDAAKHDYLLIGSTYDLETGNRSCYLYPVAGSPTYIIWGVMQKGNVVVQFEYVRGYEVIYVAELIAVADAQYDKLA